MSFLPKRKSIRLKTYDYSRSGLYFVTICTQKHLELPTCRLPAGEAGQGRFGKIDNGKMFLNDVGQMVNLWWFKIPRRFENVILDVYQIMPNHLHGIIVIRNDGQYGLTNGQTHGFVNGRTHGSAPTWGDSNHIGNPVGVNPCVDPKTCVDPNTERRNQTLFKTIQWYKTMSTNHYIRRVKTGEWLPFNKRLWQRNYYENVIRSEINLDKIRQYITANPEMWDRDKNNPH